MFCFDSYSSEWKFYFKVKDSKKDLVLSKLLLSYVTTNKRVESHFEQTNDDCADF